jgi:hypothetical protein
MDRLDASAHPRADAGALVMLAAARPGDLLVLGAVLLGALVVLVGLAAFDDRLRSRLPVPGVLRDRVIGRIGLIVGGLVLVSLALG